MNVSYTFRHLPGLWYHTSSAKPIVLQLKWVHGISRSCYVGACVADTNFHHEQSEADSNIMGRILSKPPYQTMMLRPESLQLFPPLVVAISPPFSFSSQLQTQSSSDARRSRSCHHAKPHPFIDYIPWSSPSLYQSHWQVKEKGVAEVEHQPA